MYIDVQCTTAMLLVAVAVALRIENNWCWSMSHVHDNLVKSCCNDYS